MQWIAMNKLFSHFSVCPKKQIENKPIIRENITDAVASNV